MWRSNHVVSTTAQALRLLPVFVVKRPVNRVQGSNDARLEELERIEPHSPNSVALHRAAAPIGVVRNDVMRNNEAHVLDSSDLVEAPKKRYARRRELRDARRAETHWIWIPRAGWMIDARMCHAADTELRPAQESLVPLDVAGEDRVRQRLEPPPRFAADRLRGSRVEGFRDDDRKVHCRLGVRASAVDSRVPAVFDGDDVRVAVVVRVAELDVRRVLVFIPEEVLL